MKMQGPFEVVVKHYARKDDGQIGSFNVVLAAGHVPTHEELNGVLNELKADMPPGFKSITKREFWDHVCMKTCGEVFELEGSAEWEPA